MRRIPKALVCVALSLGIGGCASVAGDWEKASKEDTLGAYREFLSDHQRDAGIYSTKATARIEQIEFEKAKAAGNRESLKAFLAAHPHGAYADEARQRIAFDEAVAANTEKGYRSFLDKYPKSSLAADANLRLRKIRYDAALAARNPGTDEKFLRSYPTGEDSEAIAALLAPVVFKNAELSNSEAGYQAFLQQFPNSAQAPEATARLRKVRYDRAVQTRTASAYESFIKQYPQGTDTAALERDLPKLRQWEQSKEKRLGEVALRMVPVAALGITAAPYSGKLSGSGLSIELSPTMKQDLAEFRELLRTGANPKLVRIAGFQPAGVTPIGRMFGAMSFGNPGTVVPAEEGGITLQEYFRANKLKAAAALLRTYGKK